MYLTLRDKLKITFRRLVGTITFVLTMFDVGMFWGYFIQKWLWLDLFKLRGSILYLIWVMSVTVGDVIICGALSWFNWLFDGRLWKWFRNNHINDYFFDEKYIIGREK